MKMNKMCRALLLLLFASTSQIVSGAAAEIKINGDTPWLVMRADYANMPIQKTIRDAERDWYKVFGYPPVIFRENSIPSRWDGPVIVFGSVENTQRLIDSQVPEGKEQHRLFLTTLASGNPSLVAAGSDTRGTVFAIYTFCEKVLGIDPMYIFTDHQPKKSSEITLAADFEIVSKKPTFEYRGWFINDEELHDGMHRDPLGGNVISMEWMDKILETLLRCKGNMIIPESSPYSDATVYDLCQRRDVVITHHHISPTGLNMMNWPKGVPFSFVTHKEILIDAWKKSVKAQQDKKVAWIIGFRGESDGAFWNSDRAAPADDAGRAAVIAEAMQTQTDIIRAVDPNATIVAALWNEQGKFYNAGLLKIPDGVCKILAEAHKAEYGIWDTMYMHVRLMDMWRTRLLLKSTIAKIEKKPYTDNYRGFMRGSFWGSAQEYMDHAEGVYPYFYKHSGRGLDVLEDKTAARKAKIFNVKTFGAVGDGVAMDTKALQAANDACSDNKGGIVWIPAGGYHIGTIRMKSNVTLSLDSGATLLGSQKISDYATDLSVPREGGVHCLIYAEDATNMVLEGLGVIDARGTPEAFPRGQGPRPRLMRMVNCNQITFSGLTYKNPASWGLHLIDCRNIHFNSITLRFRDNQYNNDGLDLDGCEDVLIENCDLNAGDDAICLKSSLNPCKNIVVRGCEVTSDTAAFKLGTSSRGGFVDVSVTNCRFYDCPMGAIKLELVDGGRLENVKISRIVMEEVGDPIFIRLGNRGRTYQRRTGQRFNADVEPEGAPIGTLKNVRISDVVAEVTGEDKSKSGPIMISGIPGHYVENVVLENIKISYPGGGTSEDAERVVPEDIARYPEQFFFGTLPAWGTYIRHARNIEFKNVELQTRAPDKRKKIVLDDVEGFVER